MKIIIKPKVQAFINEFMVDHNGKQAAIRAGYSPKTAEVQASRLLRNVKVRDALEKLEAEQAERLGLKSDGILGELKKIAFSDIRTIFGPNGTILPIHEWPDSIAAAVSSVEVVTTRVPWSDPVEYEYTSKFRLWDKKGALELLGKHRGLWNEGKLLADAITMTGTINMGPRKVEACVRDENTAAGRPLLRTKA